MKKSWDDYYLLLEEYYKEHGNLDIPTGYIVEVAGITYNLYDFLLRQRKGYRKMLGLLDSNKVATMTLDRKELLDNLKMDWDPVETSWRKYYSILKQYYEDHGNIYLSGREVIENDGDFFAVGRFLERQRLSYRKRLGEEVKEVSPISDEHLVLLEELGMIWDPMEALWQRNYELFKQYYITFGDLEIPYDYKVEIHGEVVNLGLALVGQRKAYRKMVGESDSSTYAPMTEEHLALLEELDFVDSIKQRRYLYDFGEGEKYYSRTAIARILDIPNSTFRDYFKRFQKDMYKTIKFCQILYQADRKEELETASYSNDLAFDIDINAEVLEGNLHRLPAKKPVSNIPKIQGLSLRQYCVAQGYNYRVILKKFHQQKHSQKNQDVDHILQGVIEEYETTGQNVPKVWTYGTYNNEVVLSHFFMALKLDSVRMLDDIMNSSISISDAIQKECFLQKASTYGYLEPLYQQALTYFSEEDFHDLAADHLIPEIVVSYVATLKQEYHLTQEESTSLFASLEKYTKTMNQFYIFDVGMEKNLSQKVKKIQFYHLSEQEIEESFFVPLLFHQNIMVEKKSELAQRREILRELVGCWDSFSEEERIEQRNICRLTDDEICYITDTRQAMNQLQERISTYQKEKK